MKKIENAIPKLMEVRWHSPATAFIITFSQMFIEQLEIWINKNPGPLVTDFFKKNPGFRFNLGRKADGISVGTCRRAEGIGLGGCLTHWNDLFFQSDYTFYYKIPALKVYTEELCENCNGTRLGKYNHYRCFVCNETGKKTVDNHECIKSFQDFGLTIYFFSRLMYTFAFDWSGYKDSKRIHEPKNFADQQTMHFGISENTGMCVASMEAWLHNEIVKKVWEFTESEEKEVSRAMRDVDAKLHLRMRTESNLYDYRLYGNDKTGNFWLTVPGSACTLGIDGSDFGNHWDWGRRLTPHNIDHRTAQLCFLAGLAKLDEIAVSKCK
ncbi:MAG: hypothetical protein US50_C0002G0033 [Candidatus Nomurabacteria bacterium GW2011_GWB1_37_5]|uniref:Uncharacterized protein n=1 Tax=Candidatus Nomurabacteria bacterium GW2011_GWB1_37_5 TaxID=1618742 RepID=A0A0G0GYA6_9BACT|nr:MAG: hypothetical protein US50_C0002G0033 [Candidatus Nomurabacteria bacterium GW2011_GWB1_37_5]